MVKTKEGKSMNFKGKMREKSGITLISLVVTIVILLILAGITIGTLTGNNGLLTRAQQAKNETEQAEKEEKEKLGDMEDTINEYTTGIEVQQVTDENPGVLEGNGVETDPYIINSIEDLVFFAHDVTNGNNYEGEYVSLGLSLDFKSNRSYVEPFRTDYGEYGYDGELKTLLTSQSGFIPIGSIYDIETQNFSGTFDGQNNSINNLYINFTNNDGENDIKVGFFIRNLGTITNLRLLSINIIYSRSTANVVSSIGGICGQSSPGTVKNCLVTGNISSNAPRINVGGITGTHSR